MSVNQAGIRPARIEWIQETTEGVTPSDPSWNIFSDNVISAWDWEPDANTTRLDGTGSDVAEGFFNGAETHEASFSYSLQQWYVDGSDNTVDAGGDFLRSAEDNSLNATHTVVSRSIQSSGGADGAGRRIYTVGKGGHPDSLTAPFETEDGSPIEQELTYQFEKVRQYEISQPSSSTTLDVTNNGTAEVTVTIENEGATTSEDLTVPAGATETTLETYGDIDAIELDTDVDGDVVVTDGTGTTLATIKGSQAYPADEGDLGVPALGSGSHASALGSSYIRFIDDTLSIPNIDSDSEIISGEMSVDTGLEDNTKTGSARRNIHKTNFTFEVTATLAGPKISVDQTLNYLTESTGTITWTADEGSIDFNDAFIQSPGSYTKESDNGKLQMDNTFEAETITLST